MLVKQKSNWFQDLDSFVIFKLDLWQKFLLKYNLSHSLGGIEVEVPKFKNKTIRDFITYSDGRNTLEDIAKLIGISFVESKRLFLKLKKMNLVN